jgi:leucyl aminopeptidase
MELIAKTGQPEKQRTGCLVVGIHEKRGLTPAAERVDQAAEGQLSTVLQRGDLEGKVGQSLLLQGLPGVAADRILLVGVGRKGELTEADFGKAVARSVAALADTAATDAVSFLPEVEVGERPVHWRAREAAARIRAELYRFERFKTENESDRRALKRVTIAVERRKELTGLERGVREGKAIASGVELARELGNLPGNVCTPGYLADEARKLARRHKSVTAKVLELKDLEKLGMGAFLSVARGSREPAKLIVLEYRGAADADKPVALVGKGVTFDSGGISIKPAQAMDEMKFDMCGAASVLGTLSAVAELELPLNVVGLVPATENLPDGNASKPGDIVQTMSGQTVEILNTDAEGRLILCDTLTYAERWEPRAVVDIATLTGACVVALGGPASGLLGNDQALVDELLAAGRDANDQAWQLPLWDEYQEQLKSNFADMANIGGREAGTITAACFLSRFTGKYRWAHLDIAGTAWKTGKAKGATGRPVPLLVEFLRARSEAA